MKRLTAKSSVPITMSMWAGSSEDLKVYRRLSEIEDILGDEYDLNSLKELIRNEIVNIPTNIIFKVCMGGEVFDACVASVEFDLDVRIREPRKITIIEV